MLRGGGRARRAAAARELQPPLLDTEGRIVPQPTLLQELIATHPIAYCTVAPWMIYIGGVLTSVLVSHCVYALVCSLDDDNLSRSPKLQLACAARLLGMLPRPYAWRRVIRMLEEARRQPTTLLVAHRCLLASNDFWFRLNDKLTRLYYVWIIGVVLYLLAVGEKHRSPFEQMMLQHCAACIALVLLQKALGVGAMLVVIHFPAPSMERAMLSNALERYSDVLSIDEKLQFQLCEDPCVICFCPFEVAPSGEIDAEKHKVRRLAKCGHLFHRRCIDAWLLDHRQRGLHAGVSTLSCPVCGMGIEDAHDLDDDPATTRELAWLAELQRVRF
eukprot:CAMPEP_0119376456 /NCGR_PEP_ID=MMETSP1334-20130426/40090_1 /TAXON_ID=127549 /ORGANISM="Calcidiscus leptoporus, Strain RCC1130" /LENGTH=329 /DNA_ID=CAMNT_0007395021 /DNA_START=35 /DNA_END=1024 /DNA_ORIENTATION=-